jgi:alginate O-acetyltransferase complex protein AlgI
VVVGKGSIRNARKDINCESFALIFNSLIFLPFFGIVLAVHYSPLPWSVRKLFLLFASYVFYAAWNPGFATLLVLSTVVDWWVARKLWRGGKTRRRSILLISLVLNLGLVFFFKYGNFFLGSVASVANFLGFPFQAPYIDVLLPVGISFYTFATLSYTLDVYRGELEPRFTLTDFALFVAFFPHMVAGPILRARDLLVQFESPRRASVNQFAWGMSLLVMGLCLKVTCADGVFAPVAEQVYVPLATPSTLDAWLGTLAFSGQIFCDFAGYSMCAIGIALTLGIHLVNNFRVPYSAVGFSDFWRRWHISLSSWLRDYLYIPLGGNRHSTSRTYFNLMATMLLGGLWHGASWTFLFWGGLHGVYLIGERAVRRAAELVQIPHWIAFPLGFAVTYLLTCVAWVFFRALDFPSAWRILTAMAGMAETATSAITPANRMIIPVAVAMMLAIHLVLRNQTLETAWKRIPWPLQGFALASCMILIAVGGGNGRAFIYFQF